MTPTPDSIRYPIGPFKFSDPSDSADRPVWLAQLAEAPTKLRAAVAGLSDAQLDTPYREGGWTVRQVVHHLADAHLNWYIRPKVAVTEDMPMTKTYAEQKWAELSDARTAPVESSLKIFEGLTERWCIFFTSLDPGAWSRRFQNPEWGTLSVEDVLRSMAWHTRHHRNAPADELVNPPALRGRLDRRRMGVAGHAETHPTAPVLWFRRSPVRWWSRARKSFFKTEEN